MKGAKRNKKIKKQKKSTFKTFQRMDDEVNDRGTDDEQFDFPKKARLDVMTAAFPKLKSFECSRSVVSGEESGLNDNLDESNIDSHLKPPQLEHSGISIASPVKESDKRKKHKTSTIEDVNDNPSTSTRYVKKSKKIKKKKKSTFKTFQRMNDEVNDPDSDDEQFDSPEKARLDMKTDSLTKLKTFKSRQSVVSGGKSDLISDKSFELQDNLDDSYLIKPPQVELGEILISTPIEESVRHINEKKKHKASTSEYVNDKPSTSTRDKDFPSSQTSVNLYIQNENTNAGRSSCTNFYYSTPQSIPKIKQRTKIIDRFAGISSIKKANSKIPSSDDGSCWLTCGGDSLITESSSKPQSDIKGKLGQAYNSYRVKNKLFKTLGLVSVSAVKTGIGSTQSSSESSKCRSHSIIQEYPMENTDSNSNSKNELSDGFGNTNYSERNWSIEPIAEISSVSSLSPGNNFSNDQLESVAPSPMQSNANELENEAMASVGALEDAELASKKLRKSKRKIIQPLENWRGERKIIRIKNAVVNVLGIDPGRRDDSVKNLKTKKLERTLHSSPVYNEQGQKLELVNYFHCNQWVLSPGRGTSMTKTFSSKTMSFGFLKIEPLNIKSWQEAEDNFQFHVAKGRIKITINNTTLEMKNYDGFIVPSMVLCTIENLRRTTAILTYSAVKNRMFEYQEDNFSTALVENVSN